MDPIALNVVFTDGKEQVVEAVAADLIAFESHFDLSVAKLAQDVRLTHLFFLAWHSLKRTGATSDDFDTWVGSVSIVSQAAEKK
jgi:hypothetical protein